MREDVIGRVSFANCDPLFHELGGHWRILPAPPSWLTGHLLRRECLIAPIPLADFVKNIDTLPMPEREKFWKEYSSIYNQYVQFYHEALLKNENFNNKVFFSRGYSFIYPGS